MTIYAVGDIHGHVEQLDRALGLIEADGGADATTVFLGDYTDRGPDSRGVIDRLVDGLGGGRPWICLMGNHDRMFMRLVRDGALGDAAIVSGKTWLHPSLGGGATLASYGVALPERDELERYGHEPAYDDDLEGLFAAARAAIPQAHLDFLAALALTHETDAQIFVHAGIRPGVPLDRQAEDDLLWIRGDFLDDPRDHGRLVVHGHTAVRAPEHRGNRLNLDTGAGYGRPITAAAIDGRDAWALTEAGRVPIPQRGWRWRLWDD